MPPAWNGPENRTQDPSGALKSLHPFRFRCGGRRLEPFARGRKDRRRGVHGAALAAHNGDAPRKGALHVPH